MNQSMQMLQIQTMEPRTPDEILRDRLEEIVGEIIKNIVIKGQHVNRTKTANELFKKIKEIYGE